ncbi:hypothetical protein [Magnetospirillum fulvum]|nr:hypothetical protein [Magnetospirillum fulvum]
MKYEKCSKDNPNKLTIKQHVIPVESLKRFAGDDGCVQVRWAKENKILTLKPKNEFFILSRVWDERSESGWMKRIEDRFQDMAENVLSGQIEFIAGDHAWTLAQYFSLLYWRSRQKRQIKTEIQINDLSGTHLTLEEEERLEKNHYIFMRQDGRISSRFLTGLHLQVRVDQYALQIKDWTWGVIQAQAGEFLMPDVLSHNVVPLTPKVVLAANHPNGTVGKTNLKKINTAFLVYSWNYFVARNIATAMAGISHKEILKAAKVRDMRIASGEILQGPLPAAADALKPTHSETQHH